MNANLAALTDAVRSAGPVLETTRKGATRAGLTLKHFIQANPVLAVGLSLGLGVVVGWLVKRR